MLDVRVVFFPTCGKVHEELAIRFVAVPSSRAIGSLIVLPLMPDDGADAMRQLGLLNSPQEPAVDRVDVGGVYGAGLVFLDRVGYER